MLGCLKRDLGISEQFENSKKTFVYFDAGILIDFQLTFFEHPKIVFGASRTADRKNDSGQETDNYQGFDGMLLFFPE